MADNISSLFSEQLSLAKENIQTLAHWKNAQFTIGDYEGSMGTVDLFMCNQQYSWLQIGGMGTYLGAGGIGYRYLFHEDFFIGGYAMGGCRLKKDAVGCHLYWESIGGIEIATAKSQWTFGFYKVKPEIVDYQQEGLGYSGRVTYYLMEKMGPLGHFGLIGRASSIKLNPLTEHLIGITVYDVAGGFRLESPYIAIEAKWVKKINHPVESKPWGYASVGIHIKSTRFQSKQCVKNRLNEIVQCYHPRYN